MKNIEQSQLLQVLKAALWNSPSNGVVFPTTSGEWEALLQEARRQTMVPLLFNWLSTQADLALPKDSLHRLLALSVRNRQMHQCLRRALNELDTMLQGIGVHGALLKGEGVAALYPDPDSRVCGDIDFMVGPTDYERVCQFLRERGMVDSMATESEKHLHFTLGIPIIQSFNKWSFPKGSNDMRCGDVVHLVGVTMLHEFLTLTGNSNIPKMCPLVCICGNERGGCYDRPWMEDNCSFGLIVDEVGLKTKKIDWK